MTRQQMRKEIQEGNGWKPFANKYCGEMYIKNKNVICFHSNIKEKIDEFWECLDCGESTTQLDLINGFCGYEKNFMLNNLN